MADGTKIEWTDATWNVITGCTVTSPGCANCYAMRLAGTRLASHPSRAGLTREVNGNHVWNGTVRFNDQWLLQPLRWSKPRMIFVCAHGDLFHRDVPDEWIDRVFAVMALAPQHTFQVLTKRSARMREYMSSEWFGFRVRNAMQAIKPSPIIEMFLPLPNVWLGVSAEDQPRADERIPDLLATPAAVRWVSVEPMLGPVDLTYIDHESGTTIVDALAGCHGVMVPLGGINAKIDWVVLGGESGPGARPMHPDWARSLRDQCAAAGVPFHFKQWGSHAVVFDRDVDDPDWRNCSKWERDYPEGRWLNLAGGTGFHGDRVVYAAPVGKTRAGRLIDGREHNGYPEVSRGD